LNGDASDVFKVALSSLLNQQGFNQSDCDLNSIITNWYIDLRLDNQILIQELFYTGYGVSDYPTNTQVINSINTNLVGLYNYGLNYYLAGNTLIISNSTCYDDFTNKTLYLNIGVDIQINCVQSETPPPTPTPTPPPTPTPCTSNLYEVTFNSPGGNYSYTDCNGLTYNAGYLGGGTFTVCSTTTPTSSSPSFVSAINIGACP
jgi:hypothetical protein